jgi:hypothetical protein
VQLGQQQYSYMYLYSQIALTIARAITDHTRTSKVASSNKEMAPLHLQLDILESAHYRKNIFQTERALVLRLLI